MALSPRDRTTFDTILAALLSINAILSASFHSISDSDGILQVGGYNNPSGGLLVDVSDFPSDYPVSNFLEIPLIVAVAP